MALRICFILSEIFAWGKYGGYGSMVRRLALGLSNQGCDVVAIVPRRKGQKPFEKFDKVTIFSYPGTNVLLPEIYKEANADVYHSQEASLATVAAFLAMPDRKHVVTCIDPWSLIDWGIEIIYDLKKNFLRGAIYPFLWGYYSPFITRWVVKRFHSMFSQAQFLIPKIKNLYKLDYQPTFLPNPYLVPHYSPKKSKEATVCFLARWDSRKRPEIFFELAKRFPRIHFIALGKAHNKRQDNFLRKQYGKLPNVEMLGFVDPFISKKFYDVLDLSWVMINTSVREGLPASYVESAAHRCSILSAVDADGFASRGGFHVQNENKANEHIELGGLNVRLDDYAIGLEWLLENNRWREMGERGYQYVSKVHNMPKVINQHLDIYSKLR